MDKQVFHARVKFKSTFTRGWYVEEFDVNSYNMPSAFEIAKRHAQEYPNGELISFYKEGSKENLASDIYL